MTNRDEITILPSQQGGEFGDSGDDSYKNDEITILPSQGGEYRYDQSEDDTYQNSDMESDPCNSDDDEITIMPSAKDTQSWKKKTSHHQSSQQNGDSKNKFNSSAQPPQDETEDLEDATVLVSNKSLVVEVDMVELPNKLYVEVMTCTPDSYTKKSPGSSPPLLFIAGPFHSGWCWREHYLTHFGYKGYATIAVSQRGTGNTFSSDDANRKLRKIPVEMMVDDLSHVLTYIKEEYGCAPILIAHSMSGFIAMKYMEDNPEDAKELLSGVALICSLPPVGGGPMTRRFFWRPWGLFHCLRLMKGMRMKRFVRDQGLCRIMYFGGVSKRLPDGSFDDCGVPESDLLRYQDHFKRDTKVTMSMKDLNRHTPLPTDDDGKANWLSYMPNVLVMGATDDFIVDKEGVEETSSYVGVEPVMVDSPHDVMLGRNWRNAATALLQWLTEMEERAMEKRQYHDQE